MNHKEEFVNIVEDQIKKLMDKYKLSESIHKDFYFSHGITVGMESLKIYLDKYYEINPKEEPVSVPETIPVPESEEPTEPKPTGDPENE